MIHQQTNWRKDCNQIPSVTNAKLFITIYAYHGIVSRNMFEYRYFPVFVNYNSEVFWDVAVRGCGDALAALGHLDFFEDKEFWEFGLRGR